MGVERAYRLKEEVMARVVDQHEPIHSTDHYPILRDLLTRIQQLEVRRAAFWVPTTPEHGEHWASNAFTLLSMTGSCKLLYTRTVPSPCADG